MIGEVLMTLFFLLGSIFLYTSATSFPALGPRTQVGPGFWPKILLIGIIILTSILLVKFVITRFKGTANDSSESGLEAVGKSGLIRLSLVIVLCISYVFGMLWGGFLFSSLLFQALILLVLGTRKLSKLILIPVLLTGVLFGIFVEILHVPLPRGLGVFDTLSRVFY